MTHYPKKNKVAQAADHLANVPHKIRAAEITPGSKSPPISVPMPLRGEALKSKLKMMGGK